MQPAATPVFVLSFIVIKHFEFDVKPL